MRLYFVRHGESHANLLHEISNRGLRHGLTRAGRLQAEKMASRLRAFGITRIYSSPLLRALETAFILAQRLGLEYEVVDSLRESDCGVAEGRSDDEAWKLWHWVMDSWVKDKCLDQRIQGGESFLDMRERFIPFIESLVSEYGHTHERILCVSHGGLLLMMLPLVFCNLSHAAMAGRRFENTSCIVAELRPDGLYSVEWDGHPISEVPAEA